MEATFNLSFHVYKILPINIGNSKLTKIQIYDFKTKHFRYGILEHVPLDLRSKTSYLVSLLLSLYSNKSLFISLMES